MRYFIYCRKSSEGEERQVLSLASQQEAIAKAFGDKSEIEIVGVYEEAKSAKTPGRPLFAEMLKRIEAGEAEGIASWAPDRLARNSIDGGHVVYLLDQGLLRDLKFATYTFENNSQGKFMLSIMFGQSKYYSDALSENVKRGNATKVAMGWRPNRPPIGYLNCPATRAIIADPERFPLVRRMFDLFLTGAYSARQIARIAQDQWGLLTPRRARSGGKPLDRSTIYRTLENPFYMGMFEWGGELRQGSHEPMITATEFARVRALLGRSGTTRPARYTFAYTGVLACGACGRSITAEHKVNKYGARYTYYHCAARSRISRACSERSVEEQKLDRQFGDFLHSLAIPANVVTWVRAQLQADQARLRATAATIAASQGAALTEIVKQLKELTSLRLRRMVDDEEFVQERQRLENTRTSLGKAPDPTFTGKLIELLDVVERVSIHAARWFQRADPERKQKILKTVCSNSTLMGKKLSIQATKPLVTGSNVIGSRNLWAVVDEVRTFDREGKRLLADLRRVAEHGNLDATMAAFRLLENLCSAQDQSPEAQSRQAPASPSPRLLRAKFSR
jgi:DNA invertase Pin-like site-specific DNA recombinase